MAPLNAIFRFKNQSPTTSQDPSLCESLVDVVGDGVRAILKTAPPEEVPSEDGASATTAARRLRRRLHMDPLLQSRKTPIGEFSATDREFLREALAQLSPRDEAQPMKRGDVWTERWYPQYAAALQFECVSVGAVSVRLVALDGWQRVLHFPSSGGCVHSAEPTTQVLIHCGRVDADSWHGVLNGLTERLEEASKRTGSSRSAANRETPGHQKTPSFLAALLRNAVDALTNENVDSMDRHLPMGGMTDVGKHTGGEARDTCWALVAAAFRQALPGNSELFKQFEVALYSHLLIKEIDRVRATVNTTSTIVPVPSTVWPSLDRCFEILDSIAVCLLELGQKGFDGAPMEEKCRRWRLDLDAVAQAWADWRSNCYRIPTLAGLRSMQSSKPGLDVDTPEMINFSAPMSNQPSVRGSVLTTVRHYEFIEPQSCSTDSILADLEAADAAQSAFKRIATLRVIEQFLYRAAANLSTTTKNNTLTCHGYFKLIDWYKKNLSAVSSLTNYDEIARVQLQSRYLLLSHLVFCLSHQLCCKDFPVLAKYQIALDWRRLEVCVLPEAVSRTVLLKIVRYIRQFNKKCDGPPVFDLSNHEGTRAFAREIAPTLSSITAKHEEVLSKWENHIDTVWDGIQKRKAEVSEERRQMRANQEKVNEYQAALEQEIERLEELRDAEEDEPSMTWNQRRQRYEPAPVHSSLTHHYKQELRFLRNLVAQSKARIKQLVPMPEFVVSPLPENRLDGLEVLFYLDIPYNIGVTAELCGRAQRSLGPIDLDLSPQLQTTAPCATSWSSYFKSRKGASSFDPQAQFVDAYPVELNPPTTSHGQTSIDRVGSRQSFVNSCAWYPKVEGTELLWNGRDKVYINPYRIKPEQSREYFTARVPSIDGDKTNYQWMNTYPGGLQRSNIPYATADDAGEAVIDYRAYLSLGGIRATPLEQVRKVFAAVQDDLLEWSKPLVGVVVRQALFQVGEFSDADDPRLTWHSDLSFPNYLAVFRSALQELLTKAGASPRRWNSLPLLADIVGFLDGFMLFQESLRLKLAKVARGWASDTRREWQQGVTPKEQKELRARECILYGYAILCFRLGRPLTTSESHELCELILLFRNSLLFAAGSSIEAQIRSVEMDVQMVMADQITYVVKHVSARPTWILTPACQRVNALVPKELAWKRVQESESALDAIPSCFEATHEPTGVHYLVNLFTGAILVDGAPPGGLPPEVRAMPSFIQLFGDQDFEVTTSKIGVYATVQTFHGCMYRFRVVDNDLVVEESKACEYELPSEALQLCRPEWISDHVDIVPRRLLELHSHWYWHEKSCVLVRPKTAVKRQISFVMKLTEYSSAQIFQVPRSDQNLPPNEVISRTDSYKFFIPPDSALKNALGKFEQSDFVHCFRTPQPSSVIEIELPRFGLRFVQSHVGLSSVEFSGYVLSANQQLNDHFCRFRRYLVLEETTGDASSSKQKLLVPSGKVVEHANGMVDVSVPADSSATIATNVFDLHDRLKIFMADNIESRLQLASLYTISGNLLPWPGLQMTGGEAAMEVLRGCWPSRPYSKEAIGHLHVIKQFSSRHTPSLALLVSLLVQKSCRLEFLFDTDPTRKTSELVEMQWFNDELDETSLTAYSPFPTNARRCLTDSEEWDLLGPTSLHHIDEHVRYQQSFPPAMLDDVPVNIDFVKREENKLLQLVDMQNTFRTKSTVFPLSEGGSNKTRTNMMAELQESWRIHHAHADGVLKGSLAELKTTIEASFDRVSAKRATLHKYLHRSIDIVQSRWSDRLLVAANRVPVLTISDILRCAIDDQVVLHFVPALNQSCRDRFKQAALLYLELCVLEDKLERILSRANSSPQPPLEYFVDELSCVRHWSTREHPYWLVFEVEGKIQIRPEQYVIARHLIENPGSISQLNMGRGKTRVILPMLFLYYRYNVTDRVVRAHFLSPLLSETLQFMHRVVSSGTLRLPFIELPFNRGVDLDLRDVLLMQEAVDEAKESGGFLVIAPEHRLSLELKRQEMQNSDVKAKESICKALDRLMDPAQYIDIFDESDALLHHKYHLVYAVGTPMILDGGSARWIAAQSLLRVLVSSQSKRVAQVLGQNRDMYCVQPEYSERCGAYNGFRLNTAIEATKRSRAALKKALLEDLIDQAPFEMEWLRAFTGQSLTKRALVIQAICDGSVAADSVLKLMPSKIDGAKQQLLVLRGLLAFGVLENCLEKRNRVTFGLPDPGTRLKSLAIPFTAADLPAERSEFGHPDVSIVQSLLAYYHAGLTDKDIRRAFDSLLRLDYSERNRYYDEWFSSIEHGLDQRHRVMLSKLDHISLDNAYQFAIVCDSYRYSMELINFFLNRLVFPRDTKQYPERLSRSAWDLVRGPFNIGFSGTNDTHRLLPAAVSQREPNEPSLRGTNGKMIDLLLSSTIGYTVIADEQKNAATTSPEGDKYGMLDRHPRSMWQRLLLHGLENKCQALIDTGALLAGVAIDEAAQFLIQEALFNAAGVTYYDTRKEFDCWVVLERERLVLRPLKKSSLHERDTFVIFDEARARGSDMKLRSDAIAMLTLGPSLTKDKLMQGAGRMRQLGRNQKLWLTSTTEVKNSVAQLRDSTLKTKLMPVHSKDRRRGADLGLVDVLNWVVENTQQQCTLGLLEWAQNGIQFCAKEIDSKNELQAEDWTLEKQYNSAVTDELIYDVVRQRLDVVVERNGEILKALPTSARDDAEHVFDRIDDRAFTYGYEDEVHVSSYEEECERELQVEEEEEVHAEEKGPSLSPATEVIWDVSRIFNCTTAAQVSAKGIVVSNLSDAAAKWAYPPACGKNVRWGVANVYATSNFWMTVIPPGFSTANDRPSVRTRYLRMIDTLVVFLDGSILALTDIEANALLKEMSAAPSQHRHFHVVNLTFACRAIANNGASATFTFVPLVRAANVFRNANLVPITSIIACCLFNGDTHFVSTTQEAVSRRALQELLRDLKLREPSLQAFVEARRFPQRWTRSFLHRVAKEMDLAEMQ